MTEIYKQTLIERSSDESTIGLKSCYKRRVKAAYSASSRRTRPTGAGAQEQRTLNQLQAQT